MSSPVRQTAHKGSIPRTPIADSRRPYAPSGQLHRLAARLCRIRRPADRRGGANLRPCVCGRRHAVPAQSQGGARRTTRPVQVSHGPKAGCRSRHRNRLPIPRFPSSTRRRGRRPASAGSVPPRSSVWPPPEFLQSVRRRDDPCRYGSRPARFRWDRPACPQRRPERRTYRPDPGYSASPARAPATGRR